MSELIDSALKERALQDRRKNNIVIFKCPEDASLPLEQRQQREITLFSQICHAINVPQLETARYARAGPITENEIRPLKVTLTNEADKYLMLKNAKKLKDDHALSNISLAPDYTPAQQAKRKALVTELRQRKSAGETNLVIRREQIVQINQGNEQVAATAQDFH